MGHHKAIGGRQTETRGRGDEGWRFLFCEDVKKALILDLPENARGRQSVYCGLLPRCLCLFLLCCRITVISFGDVS